MEKKHIILDKVSYVIWEKEILKDISLNISEGERVAVCGPNGAGKSTLINLMLNISGIGFNSRKHKISGRIENTLFDVNNYTDVKVHLQNSKISYNLHLKVSELLKLCFGDEIPIDMLEEMGLKEKINDRVITLSGGEFQKLNIILTIASKPKVIFLDEMTTGLDYEAKKEIISYIQKYISRNNSTLIFVTHYLDEIPELADKILFIKKGEIVEQGKLDELFTKYRIEKTNMEKLYEEVIVHE